KTAKVVESTTGKVLHTLEHKAGVTVTLFSPDGKYLATGGGERTIKLWDYAGKLSKSLEGHEGTVTRLDFSSDGKKLVSAGVDQRVKIWDVHSGKELKDIKLPTIAATVAFTPDGQWLAAGCIDQTIRLFRADGQPGMVWSAHGVAVTGLAFSPDGQYLASSGVDYLVRVWPVTGGKGDASLTVNTAAAILLPGHAGPGSGVAFRRDSQHLVSCGSDLVVKLWKIEAGAAKEMQTYRGHRDWVTSVCFSKDGYFVLSTSVDRSAKIWEITSREIPLQSEHTGAVEAVAISPDGKLIASGATDQTIKLWDREQGVEVRTISGHGDAIQALAFTPDGKTLISTGGDKDRSIRLWDVATGQALLLKEAHRRNFFNLINAVPYMVAAAGKGGPVLLAWVPGNERYTTLTGFDLTSGEELFSFHDTNSKKNRHVQCVSFTPDGKWAATGARDGSVRIF